jgi:beta-mannosidase
MKSLTLNGVWQLTYNTLGKNQDKWNRTIPATVPGDIHLDLMAAGLICEPLISDNSKKYHWIEEKEWWYSKKFEVSETFFGKKIELVCDGLDLTADIWVNGVLVGSANNMFVQHRFDVGKVLCVGENEILVRLDVGFNAVGDVPTEKFAKSWGREEPRRPWMRKAQQSFYWDVAPRLLTCGIWRDIYLESFDEVILSDVYVTSQTRADTATVSVFAEITSSISDICELEVVVKDEKSEIIRKVPVALHKGEQKKQIDVELKNPKLWWPNGMGNANLYQVSIRLLNEDGYLYGEKQLKHGIRTIEILQESLNENERTFTVVVNGFKVFCKGGNWVPSDSIYARINREKEYKLLKYAQEANFNMIRIWGGGVYPDTFFYEICDELGIMVWQDFMYACAYYPDFEPAFCAGAKEEAEKVVRKFRNHASLALWCGNNETYWMHNRVDPNGEFYGLKIYAEILPAAIKHLDPKTYYHPSSPYPGPAFNQENQGDQHIWSYVLGWYELNHRSDSWDYSEEEKKTVMKIWDIPELNHKFISEFGIYCPSNMASMQKFMGEHPVRTEGEIYQHHRNHFEADFILEMLRRYYKHRDDYSLEEFIIAGQMVQSEALKYIFEEFRSRMYVCSGTLFWEYNDAWGHIGYTPVDYYLNVKPLYYYMRRVFAPVHAVFKNQANQLWVLNDKPQEQSLEIEYGVMSFSGKDIFNRRKRILVPACSAMQIDSLEAELIKVSDAKQAFAYVKVYDSNGGLLERNRQFLVPLEEINLPEDSMTCEITAIDRQTWKVDVSARDFVHMVKIDADENLQCSDNSFDLWPGERRIIEVCTESIHPDIKLRVDNINKFVNQ